MNFCCNEKTAGVAKVDFYLLTETSGWPQVVTDSNAGTITLDPEEVDVDGTIEPDSISIADRPRQDAEGTTWNIDIGFNYLSRSEALEQLLEQYANQPGIAIACFNDNSRKLFGTAEQPVYLSWESLYGEKPEDRTGVRVTIKGEMRQRPPYYNPEEE